jgi:hypothetical protein
VRAQVESIGVAILILATAGTGCGPSHYMVEEPRVFVTACVAGGRDASLDSVLDAMAHQRGWIVENVDRDHYQVDARVCRGNMCSPVTATVNPDGRVSFLRDPTKKIDGDWAEVLASWMNRLEANYSRRRCERSD